ncbi:unnamed protein product, partial [Amoebophrya sp. A25]|eukprot:GSA25T00018764001.1
MTSTVAQQPGSGARVPLVEPEEVDAWAPPPRRRCLDRWIKYFIDPRRTCHVLFIHFLVCCFIPGPYFFDSLWGAYKGDLLVWMDIDNTQYGLILAIGSLSA